ncbi:hypothetical protein WPS_18300 [Vulcanimicrobium alpinum]|uniref:Carbon monoxide dehydrogenase n=1 Tax=Vulcanimicrobium alpinum TaxID=3016050 RepID=A0AAN2C9Q4_UNVUL|nr:carbon monoxide dehydrogenase subunit G [Vulcanimicrobium alpinum]BDE06554.1 hypothetical protein WPS_18300 [Vulcanimicrobium alpinum]
MNLTFQGRERIPAPRATVWAFINDPEAIASCMPDVISTTIRGPHAFEVVVRVAVGPVKGKFTFKVTLAPSDDASHMGMTISGGGFGSVVDLPASAEVSDDPAGGTILDWQGTATMRGPVATVGGRVLDAQAKRVITTTFANVKSRLSATA